MFLGPAARLTCKPEVVIKLAAGAASRKTKIQGSPAARPPSVLSSRPWGPLDFGLIGPVDQEAALAADWITACGLTSPRETALAANLITA